LYFLRFTLLSLSSLLNIRSTIDKSRDIHKFSAKKERKGRDLHKFATVSEFDEVICH